MTEPEACPLCGGEVMESHYPATFAVPEAWVKWCTECNWEGEPE